MNNTQPQQPRQATREIKPLSVVEKVKAGTKSFFKSMADYVPAGLIFMGLAYGGSALIETFVPGMGGALLNVMGPPGVAPDVGAIASRVAGTMAFSSVVAGTIGSVQGVMKASEQRNDEIAYQKRGLHVSPRERGRAKEQSSGRGTTPAVQSDLPTQRREHSHEQGQQAL